MRGELKFSTPKVLAIFFTDIPFIVMQYECNRAAYILSRLDRSSMEINVRRAFTSVRAADHPGGEPPLLPDSGASAYERARNMAGHVAQAMKQASRGYPPVCPRIGPAPGSHDRADRVFCFYDMQGAGLSQGRSISEEMASQTTWGQKVRSPRIALGGKLIHAQ
jgi:hypothetical protein